MDIILLITLHMNVSTFSYLIIFFFLFFFFSSRRRHTRLTCDWSSDVCSSDLHRLERVPCERLRVDADRADAGPERRPELVEVAVGGRDRDRPVVDVLQPGVAPEPCQLRSEEHTSELQSHVNLVCRLLLEKKQL